MSHTEIFRAAATLIASGMFDELKMIERDAFMPNVRGLAVGIAMRLWNDVGNAIEYKCRHGRVKPAVTDPDGEDSED